MSPELDAVELDIVARALSIPSITECKPSAAITSFCLALACCACEQVPASLFYRPCRSRREWHSSGEIVDSQTHFEDLPSWLFTLFDDIRDDHGSGTQRAISRKTVSVPESQPSTFRNHPVSTIGDLSQVTSPSKPRSDSLGRSPSRENVSWPSTRRKPQKHAQIHLENVGVRPNDVGPSRRSHLILSPEFQILANSRGLAVTTSEGVMYFALAEIWKETILQAASEKLCVQTWTILVNLASCSMPSPYTEPLWQVFHSQLEEVILGTILPFLSVIDLKHFQAWSYQSRQNLFLLLIYERLYGSTRGSPCLPFGLEISQYLRSSSRNEGDFSSSLVFLAEWLDGLNYVLEVSESSLKIHLDSWSAKVANDARMKFLVLLSIDTASISHCVRQSAGKTSTLRNWWQGQQAFGGCITDQLTEVLWQARNGTTISLASVALVSDHDTRSALGFALAQRQRPSEARLVLGDCIIRAQGLWPDDSPARVLLLTEFINCSNTLGDEIRGESPATEALKQIIKQDLPYRFDNICLNVALADSYIRQCDYKTASEILADIIGNAELSDDVLLRIALRLSKITRRLVKAQEATVVHGKLLEKCLAKLENVPEDLRFECLEETYAVATGTGQHISSDNNQVRQLLRNHFSDRGQPPSASEQWRLSAIQATLDSDVGPCNEIVNSEGDIEMYKLPRGRPASSPARQQVDLNLAVKSNPSWLGNRAAKPTSAWDGSNQFHVQRSFSDLVLNKTLPHAPINIRPHPPKPIIIRVLVYGDRPLKNEISRFTILEGSVAFEAVSTEIFLKLAVLRLCIPESWKISDTKAPFDLAIVNLGDRHDEIPEIELALRCADYWGPIVGVVTSLGHPSMQHLLDSFCDGIFEQPRLHDRHLSSTNRLPHLVATVLQRRQMEMLTKYYCHGRLSQSLGTSLSSTEDFRATKPPLVIGRHPKMILFSVSSGSSLSTKLDLSRMLVDAPGLYPVHITNNVFPHLLFQDRRFFEKTWSDHLEVISAVPDPHDIRIGSLIMDLGKVEEKIAFMLGDHGANHELQMINDTPDYSMTVNESFLRVPPMILTTKRKRVQRMLNPSVFLADFLKNIVQLHIKLRTTETSQILHRLSKGRTFYLITGYRTYLDPELRRLDRKSDIEALAQTRPLLNRWVGSKIAALELCEITVPYNPNRFEVGEPKWYFLWGPHDPDDYWWPPKPAQPAWQYYGIYGNRTRTLGEIAELCLPAPTALEPKTPPQRQASLQSYMDWDYAPRFREEKKMVGRD